MLRAVSFGLFLNCGAQLGATHAAVFDLTLEQARLAELLGYRDVWVTEHHFIDFGLSSNALTLAGFLLGRTHRLRVGTAVTLAPQYHSVQLAEQVAMLDQLSHGRLDFGIGRGGYLKEFEVFGIDRERYLDEIGCTTRTLLRCWTAELASANERWARFEDVPLRPRPRTLPHPPLFLASSSAETMQLAAEHGLPLLHYFATPALQRVAVEASYLEAGGDAHAEHVHVLPVVVTDDEAAAREQLAAAMTDSFRAGDHPAVLAASGRHRGPDGRPLDRSLMALYLANAVPVGSPVRVAAQLKAFLESTKARRVVLYMEAIADRFLTLSSIERFATQVVPLLD